jgi:hypothetical protein
MRIRIQLYTSMRIRILLLIKVMGFYSSRPIDPPGSVADPDPGSGAFLTPGSGIQKKISPDPGFRTHIFESLVTIFG